MNDKIYILCDVVNVPIPHDYDPQKFDKDYKFSIHDGWIIDNDCVVGRNSDLTKALDKVWEWCGFHSSKMNISFELCEEDINTFELCRYIEIPKTIKYFLNEQQAISSLHSFNKHHPNAFIKEIPLENEVNHE